MATIVAGRYDSISDAEEAARTLYARGYSVWDVSVFTVGGAADGATTGRASEGATEVAADGGKESGGNPDGGAAREAGVLLAVRAGADQTQDVIEGLMESGARDLEQAEGTWEGGQWTDFDPSAAPRRLSIEQGEPWPRSQVAKQAVQTNETGNEDPGSEIEAYVEQQVSTDAGEDRPADAGDERR